MRRASSLVRAALRRARSRAAFLTIVVCAIALCASGSGAAGGEPDARAEAARLVDQGVEQFARGDYDGALARFRAAYQVLPSPKIFLDIAAAYEKLGRGPEAADAYERFLAEMEGHDDVGEDKKRQARARLTELRATLGRLTLELRPEAARATIDGQPTTRQERPLYVRPGSHRLEVLAAGCVPRTVTFALSAGEQRDISVSLDPIATNRVERAPAPRDSAAPPGRSAWPFLGLVTAAAGAASIGVGVYFAVQATARANEVNALLDAHQMWDAELARSGERADMLSKVFFAAGGAALVGGGVLYLSTRKPSRSRTTAIAVRPTWGGLSAEWQRRF